jgi:hypothetical protein
MSPKSTINSLSVLIVKEQQYSFIQTERTQLDAERLVVALLGL